MRCKTVGGMLVLAGMCLILCSGLLIGYNLYDSVRAEESVAHTMMELHEILPEEPVPVQKFTQTNISAINNNKPGIDIPYYAVDPKIEMPEQEIDGIPYIGVLEIPALALELPVVSRWSKANARVAPCRYKGSVYVNDMIICAHNYQSHFGGLSSLSVGDSVLFTDMEGNLFRYQIMAFEVMDGTDIEQMESGDWDLTLFTCTYGGKSRLTVRCERADG